MSGFFMGSLCRAGGGGLPPPQPNGSQPPGCVVLFYGFFMCSLRYGFYVFVLCRVFYVFAYDVRLCVRFGMGFMRVLRFMLLSVCFMGVLSCFIRACMVLYRVLCMGFICVL